MSFEQGMQLGLSAFTQGRRQNLEDRIDARAQQLHDEKLRQNAEVRGIMDDYVAGGQLPQQAMTFQEGPPAPGTEEPFYAYDGPPTPPTVPAGRDDSLRGQAGLNMRLARARGNVEAFSAAAGADAAVSRNMRYAELGDRAEAGDPELMKLVNQQNPFLTVVKRGNGFGLVAVDGDGQGRDYNLSKQDMRKLAIGNAMIVEGDLQGGMAMIDAVNKDLGALIKDRNKTILDAAQENRQADEAASLASYRTGMLQQGRDNLTYNYASLAQRDAELQHNRENARLQGLQVMTNPQTGETMLVGVRPNGQGGIESYQVPLPQGFGPLPKGSARPAKIGRDGDYELIPGTQQPGMWQEGELLARGAPPPSSRAEFLKKAGIDENRSDAFARNGQLTWITQGPTAGTEVIFDGKAYNVLDKGDITALNKAMTEQTTTEQKRTEEKRAGEVGARQREDRRTFPSLGASPMHERVRGMGGALTPDDVGAAGRAMQVPTTKRSAPIGSPVSYKDKMWGPLEATVAQRTGVPEQVIRAVRLHGERSNGDQVSPRGARGVYQFTPSSRNAFLRKYGVDAYSSDPEEQVMAVALHLRESYQRTGDWTRAVAGYNGGISGERGTNRTRENADYVRRVAPQINT